MKRYITHLSVCLCLLFLGCSSQTPTPRFAGTVVAHVDSYGSGTGTSTKLSANGNLGCGFHYGDSSKTDWNANIKWTFLQKKGNSDLYRLDWDFDPKSSAESSQSATLTYNGIQPAILTVNKQFIISIEPKTGSEKT